MASPHRSASVYASWSHTTASSDSGHDVAAMTRAGINASGEPVAQPVRLTLATSTRAECELAGTVDGPYDTAEEFEAAVNALLTGSTSVRQLLRDLRAQQGEPLRWWQR